MHTAQDALPGGLGFRGFGSSALVQELGLLFEVRVVVLLLAAPNDDERGVKYDDDDGADQAEPGGETGRIGEVLERVPHPLEERRDARCLRNPGADVDVARPAHPGQTCTG